MEEGWLESRDTTDEGYMGRLLDEAMQMVERLHTLLDKVNERLLGRQSEQDWGLSKPTNEGISTETI